MKHEQITARTVLSSMEPTDAYGWSGWQKCPFRLVTSLEVGGQSFWFSDLFERRPTAEQVVEHEGRALVRVNAKLNGAP